MRSALDIFETPVTVTFQQENFINFTVSEITLTFGELTFAFCGDNVYFWGFSEILGFLKVPFSCCWRAGAFGDSVGREESSGGTEWLGGRYRIAFFGALNFQTSEPGIWPRTLEN